MTKFRINPGIYRHRVTFQTLVSVQNSYGEIVKNDEANWINVLDARVGIFPLSGKDVLTSEFVNSEITHKISMRYHPTVPINSTMRIKFGARIFDIISPPVNFQEKNVEYQFLCKERVVPIGS